MRSSGQSNLLQMFRQEERSVAPVTVASASSVTASSPSATESSASSAASRAGVSEATTDCQLSVFAYSQHMRDSTTKAEIIHCLKLASDRASFRSADHSGDVFQHLFPDIEIVKNFQLSKDKTGYFFTFGLGEYYREKAIDTVVSAGLLPNQELSVLYGELTLNYGRQLSPCIFPMCSS